MTGQTSPQQTYPNRDRDQKIVDALWSQFEQAASPGMVALAKAYEDLSEYVTKTKPNTKAKDDPAGFERAYRQAVAALQQAMLEAINEEEAPQALIELTGSLLDGELCVLPGGREVQDLHSAWFCLNRYAVDGVPDRDSDPLEYREYECALGTASTLLAVRCIEDASRQEARQEALRLEAMAEAEMPTGQEATADGSDYSADHTQQILEELYCRLGEGSPTLFRVCMALEDLSQFRGNDGRVTRPAEGKRRGAYDRAYSHVTAALMFTIFALSDHEKGVQVLYDNLQVGTV